MAALTATARTRRLPLGDRAIKVYRVTTGARAVDEYFDTDFSFVEAVISASIVDTATLGAPGSSYTATEQGILDDSAPVQFVLNKDGVGTDGAGAGQTTRNGAVALWAPRAVTVDVVVLGKV